MLLKLKTLPSGIPASLRLLAVSVAWCVPGCGPNEIEIAELIRIAELPEAVEAVRGYPNDPRGLRLWVAAAAAGWPRELVREFLKRCLPTTNHQLRLAAEQALKGKYVKWSPY